ncbi:hypothetical protein GQ600_11692 [Phytophthora cactorum]|nr:hypothetical protein GQ600_11692 [Phytophthora cactorum]
MPQQTKRRSSCLHCDTASDGRIAPIQASADRVHRDNKTRLQSGDASAAIWSSLTSPDRDRGHNHTDCGHQALQGQDEERPNLENHECCVGQHDRDGSIRVAVACSDASSATACYRRPTVAGVTELTGDNNGSVDAILIADIPDWFVEAYESDDYDTDALMFIMRPVSPSRRRSVESRHSSPGLNDVQGMKSC